MKELEERDFEEEVSLCCIDDLLVQDLLMVTTMKTMIHACFSQLVKKNHEPRESPDYQIVNGTQKRRQRQCKVCSNRKRHVGDRRATKYFCAACSPSDKTRTYLCNKVWPHYPGNALVCHQICTTSGATGPTALHRAVAATFNVGKLSERSGQRQREKSIGDAVIVVKMTKRKMILVTLRVSTPPMTTTAALQVKVVLC
ncbi:hypothetical protein L916_07240 [Phytophthora nicotianae]|uniref:PiggyBac transposable element-derived protein 4 C-terminal zinc-ribbon domain-containing protein n=1 Tax=Phytophthora nicotianae TaxID=4792 RepID=W2J862_PHYNI|nr:hypothetical protein L916_07240 [Phytophthora nicotianae]